LTGTDVKNGSLTGSDIKKKSVTLNRLKGQLPAGPRGLQGNNGANGTNASTHVVVRSHFVNGTVSTVSCNPGETVTGGGAFGSDGLQETVPVWTGDEGTPATGWRATATGNAGLLGTYAYVMCASP
jgi:hypothetical protein